MRKLYTVSGILLAVGLILCIVAFAVNGFTFRGIFTSSADFVDRTYEPEDDISSLYVKVTDADVKVCRAEDGVTRVVLRERADAPYTVVTEHGALRIKEDNKLPWYKQIGIRYDNKQITVFLGGNDYDVFGITCVSGSVELAAEGVKVGTLGITVTSGDIRAENTQVAGTMTAASTSGAVTIRNVICEKVSLTVVSGRITAEGLTASSDVRISTTSGGQSISSSSFGNAEIRSVSGNVSISDSICRGETRIKTTSGNVRFDRLRSSSLHVETTSGAVKGTLIGPMLYSATSTSGKVSVPQGTSGGSCYIRTTSGDVSLTETDE